MIIYLMKSGTFLYIEHLYSGCGKYTSGLSTRHRYSPESRRRTEEQTSHHTAIGAISLERKERYDNIPHEE